METKLNDKEQTQSDVASNPITLNARVCNWISIHTQSIYGFEWKIKQKFRAESKFEFLSNWAKKYDTWARCQRWKWISSVHLNWRKGGTGCVIKTPKPLHEPPMKWSYGAAYNVFACVCTLCVYICVYKCKGKMLWLFVVMFVLLDCSVMWFSK